MALPALAAVRAALPDTHVTIAAIAAVAPVFEEDTTAAPDAVLTLPDRKRETRILADGKFDAAAPDQLISIRVDNQASGDSRSVGICGQPA